MTTDATPATGAPPRGGRIGRYAIAGIGPVMSAGVQFLQSLALLRVLAPQDFGGFSFLLIAAQFSWGLWSALFCAPLPILFASRSGRAREDVLACLFSTNLIVAACAALLFLALALAVGVAPLGAVFYAGFAAVALLRWFGRSYAYVQGRPVHTMASDLVYSGTLAISVALVLFGHAASLDIAFGSMFVSMALALLPFGGAYLRRQFARFRLAAVRGYGAIFREHSRWSLAGVATTEATANSHAYIVTAVMGPRAFAPIAAAQLMIRPIAVALNALMEFERAQMARDIGAGRHDAADAAVTFFRRVMIGVWLVTAIAAALVLTQAPHLLFPPRYAVSELALAAGLWMVVAAVRLIRAPESAFLQAAGAFGPLARTSMVSCIVSVTAVVILLLYGGPLWSILGILLGEAVFAFRTWRQARAWLATRRREVQAGGASPDVDGEINAAG